jgi:hypothetical protein
MTSQQAEAADFNSGKRKTERSPRQSRGAPLQPKRPALQPPLQTGANRARCQVQTARAAKCQQESGAWRAACAASRRMGPQSLRASRCAPG